MPAISEQRDDSVFDRLCVYQWLVRSVQPHLSPAQTTLMLYLIDQSVGYGRDWLRVSEEQILTGTGWGLPRLNLSRASFYRARKELDELGLIRIGRPASGGRGGVCTYTVNLAWEGSMPLPEPKRKKGLNLRLEGSQFEIKGSQFETPKIHSIENESNETGSPAARGSDSAEEIIHRTVNKARSPKKRSDGSTDLQWLWREGWTRGEFQTLPTTLNKTDLAILNKALGKLPRENRDAVLLWTMEHWHLLLNTLFDWMQKPPRQPNVRFISRFIDDIATAHDEDQYQSTRGRMTYDEEKYNQLRRAGLTHDEAVAKIAVDEFRAKNPGTPAKSSRLQAIEDHNRHMEEAERERRTHAANAPQPSRPLLTPGTLDGAELDAALDRIAATRLPDWEDDE